MRNSDCDRARYIRAVILGTGFVSLVLDAGVRDWAFVREWMAYLLVPLVALPISIGYGVCDLICPLVSNTLGDYLSWVAFRFCVVAVSALYLSILLLPVRSPKWRESPFPNPPQKLLLFLVVLHVLLGLIAPLPLE